MRLRMLTFLSMISIFAAPPLFAAEASLDTVVVTATRTDEDIEKLPSSITVVTEEDISNSTAATVQDVLENVDFTAAGHHRGKTLDGHPNQLSPLGFRQAEQKLHNSLGVKLARNEDDVALRQAVKQVEFGRWN